MRLLALLACAWLGSACALKPIDPWRRGAWSLERRDLDSAMRAFDEVPLQHVRYPESRAAVLAVARTMRHCDELLRDAMQLRSEGRDAEALAILHRTRALWADAPGVDELIAATEQRQRLARPGVAVRERVRAPDSARALPVGPAVVHAAVPDSRPAAATVEVPVAAVEPLAQPTAGEPEVVEVDPLAAATLVAPAAPATPERVEATPIGQDAAVLVGRQPAAGGDEVTAALVAVEARLLGADRQAAMDQLLAMSRQYPDDMRVRVRASRLLHQRALVRYGDGAIEGAVADWRRVLELDPGHATAATLLRAAEREALPIGSGPQISDGNQISGGNK